MREVNFSIPSANKASVGITTALYDRRALDTTSALPLINSLNNLAYLTTSSARIRDILTIDGGVERLVCILKQGRNNREMMECWKWNLAFQCVVNIGVRGSENVRTRVVEADVVPVIATILDNYIRVIDKCREAADSDAKRSGRHFHERSSKIPRALGTNDLLSGHGLDRIRRQPPPPIEIPDPQDASRSAVGSARQDPNPQFSLSSPPERTTFARTHHHQRSFESQTPGRIPTPASRAVLLQPFGPLGGVSPEPLGIRPVRDIDRLPSMLPGLQAEFLPPDSPTTPNAPVQMHNARGSPIHTTRRPSIRHHLSVSSQSDLLPVEEPMDTSNEIDPNPAVEMESDINLQEIEAEAMEGGGSPLRLEPQANEPSDVDTLNMARSALESGISNVTNRQAPTNLTLSPAEVMGMINTVPPTPIQLNPYARYVQERSQLTGPISTMPRDEDVLMCLQLLAYVSKYCNLRSYFQQSHLVPKLKIPKAEMSLIEGGSLLFSSDEEELIEEYLQPDDFNIFPLVEKFTVRHHTADMQYWARVVMRNLCRKDDSKGGIRQCAYYQCGKWEEYTRQFAKCRRCRRTKYCSKECQKSAWVFHRHWCVEAQQ
jgi:MYND finger